MARTPAPDTRERILFAASRLFYDHGVRAVGTDRVVAAAGTGKKLLYQHFPTKDDLVAAYLDLVCERRTAAGRQARADAGADPGDQLVAVVAEVGGLLRDPTFRGCAFRNHLVEHPDPPDLDAQDRDDPDRRTPSGVARTYLADSRAVVDELAAQLGTAEPGAVADQVWLLVDALYLLATYRTRHDGDVDRRVDAAVRLARTIVDTAAASRDAVRGRITRLLEAGGVADIPHPGGSLHDHLDRTAHTLEGWGAPARVVDAGRLHAAYGTDGFPGGIPGLTPTAIRAAAGAEVERLVDLYGRCDRARSYPTFLTDSPVIIDRHTSEVVPLPPAQLRAFAELTAANELDVVEHSPSIAAQHGPALSRLFVRLAPLLSPGACAAWSAMRPPAGS